MFFCRKKGKGECLASLKALVGRREAVHVQVQGGLWFIDEVVGVERSDGRDYAVFERAARVAVEEILTLEPPPKEALA